MLSRLEPEDLEMIICGSKNLDFSKLKTATRYHDGYDADSACINYLWAVLESFNEEEKKKFLFFTTGCDKAPINGLGELRLTIIKHGENNDLLPSAHTCFNHLLLPDYKSAEILREKLLIAIHNSEGFGLM